MAKKHYTPKDINKNNKLDPWEVAKYEAINSATPMLNITNSYKHLQARGAKRIGNNMIFGNKQVNTPTAFSSYDYGVLMDAAGSEVRAKRDAEYGVGPNVSRESGVVKVEYVNPAGEQNISNQEASVVEAKSNKKPIEKAGPVVITKKGERVTNKLARLQRRKELQEFKGKQRLAKGFTLGANQKRQRIANIEKREERIKNRLK